MAAIEETSVPRLARHIKFRFDEARQAWVLLAPERVLMPDEIAVEILKRCDGNATVGAIVDDLARIYEADRNVILTDVIEMLQDLADKGIIVT